MTNAAELADLGIHSESGNGVVATVGGVHKLAVIRNLNICAGVFAAIKPHWQRAGRVEGLELAGGAVEFVVSGAPAVMAYCHCNDCAAWNYFCSPDRKGTKTF